MVPEQLFKRRPQHNNTPEMLMLIIVNFIVFAVSVQVFAMCSKINSFFWVVLGFLALYNFYTIRRNREELDRVRIIAYVVSLVVMVALFFLFRSRATPC
ncbi:hypothetical protein LT679_08615 [Mucilaginibacter roseus]|uniref:Uncharacterized protein n=1 Tax=Mucilaginibacter roseus TaxID=1528868 RepID=A0ABS8U0M7_9SPHI|nr:hypothetical protein [Mucilaginibacter roseus]MCD8740659.1 hypothetical protein [Mucilaginibacter roseus]